MNIRVDLTTPINDGTEVVFRSPVDCSQVTGLIVYYQDGGNTTSKEFAFTDAHGNNVGDIDHLFAENVVVKVILDVTTGMAFVQNADTNAYLEGRFEDIENRIGSGGGTAEGANALIVTVTDNVASHTPAEMLQHINNGGSITARVAEDGGNGTTAYRSICPITINMEEAHFFETWDEDVIYKWDVQQNRSVTGHEMDNAFFSPTVHKLQEDVGNIETALDSILAIQNELIGGDA